jgi:hypothetical protein
MLKLYRLRDRATASMCSTRTSLAAARSAAAAAQLALACVVHASIKRMTSATNPHNVQILISGDRDIMDVRAEVCAEVRAEVRSRSARRA